MRVPYERCSKCKFKLHDNQCFNCGVAVLARIEVKNNPPKLEDYHQVDEKLEPTLVLDEPLDYAEQWEGASRRTERPTIPLTYHRLPAGTLEQSIMKKRG